MHEQEPWNRPASFLNVRLRVAKVRFALSEFKILHVLHNLSEKKRKREPWSVVQANSSKSKVTFHTIMSLWVVFSLSTPCFKHEKSNDPVHLFWRLYRQDHRHSKHKTFLIDHVHTAVHGSMTYGCQIANKAKFTMYAKMHKLLGDVTRRHYNAQNSDSSVPHAPHGLGGGDVWHFRLVVHYLWGVGVGGGGAFWEIF